MKILIPSQFVGAPLRGRLGGHTGPPLRLRANNSSGSDRCLNRRVKVQIVS